MSRSRTEKPINTKVYLGDENRARRLEKLGDRMGTTSASETVRRLIDRASEHFDLYEVGEQLPLKW